MDAAGRLVIPKSLRDAAGLEPGMPLQTRLRDGRIEIEPAPIEVELVDKHGVLVAVPVGEPTSLGNDDVNEVLDRLRSERG